MAPALWPLFGLAVHTPRLTLRLPDDGDLEALGARAAAGVHDPRTMPFCNPWTDQPAAHVARSVAQHQWHSRAAWHPDDWTLPLAVFTDDGPVGVQQVHAHRFAVTRTVGTASWLARSHQGRGLGREMRRAALHLVFDGLGAEWATSGGFADNHASLAVSRSLGYRPDGIEVRVRRGQRAVEHRLRLDRSAWSQQPTDDLSISGLDGLRGWFGAEAEPGAEPW